MPTRILHIVTTISLFLGVFLQAVPAVLAASPFDLGSKYNPIYIQPVQTEAQQVQQKIYQLQMLYGPQAYQKCAPSPSFSLWPPEMQMRHLGETEYCLQRNARLPSIPSTPVSNAPSQLQCTPGYVPQNGFCVTPTHICQNKFGASSIWSGNMQNGTYLCDCKPGFAWDASGSSCSALQPVLPPLLPSCSADQVLDGTQCVTYDVSCQKFYGQFSVWSKTFDKDKRYICDCAAGYGWNTNQTACVMATTPVIVNDQAIDQALAQEIALTKPNKATASKYRGRILLQTTSADQAPRAWYVNPKDLKRYYLQSDAEILAVLQKMAKFVTPAQFKQLQKNPKALLGYFVVVTNEGGHYFGNISDNKLYKIQEFSASQALTALVKVAGSSVPDGELRKIGVGGAVTGRCRAQYAPACWARAPLRIHGRPSSRKIISRSLPVSHSLRFLSVPVKMRTCDTGNALHRTQAEIRSWLLHHDKRILPRHPKPLRIQLHKKHFRDSPLDQ